MHQTTRLAFALAAVATLAGCASSAPTKIGADTYFSSKTNTAGAFGNVQAIAGELMAEGGALCASQGKEFELVTQQVQPPVPLTTLGNASITFKCVAAASNPIMRRDNGVTTIERR